MIIVTLGSYCTICFSKSALAFKKSLETKRSAAVQQVWRHEIKLASWLREENIIADILGLGFKFPVINESGKENKKTFYFSLQ